MALFDELHYVDDDYYDVNDVDDHSFNDSPRSSSTLCDSDFDSDFEDSFELNKAKTDTSAVEVKNGKDIQGIPWERLNFTRDEYRELRLKQYKNRESEQLQGECKDVKKGHRFYDFHFNTRLVKLTIVHFQVYVLLICQDQLFCSNRLSSIDISGQCVLMNFWGFASCWEERKYCSYGTLRNLLAATSKHDVYLMQNYSVMHWSSLRRRGEEVLNVSKPIVPATKYTGSVVKTLSRVQISSMAVKDNLMAAGGFRGELICKHLHQKDVAFCSKLTAEKNVITNAVDICQSPNRAMRIMASNNDAQVRVFDVNSFACLNCFTFPWSVNNTSVSPDGRLLAVLGDNSECLLADSISGKVVNVLKGHLDYSFASAWHPGGRILATGNQDNTCRLWDIRNLSKSLSVLNGRVGAIRAIKFSTDGRYMAMAEAADFVHIFDTQSDYATCQEIDLFGEIGGICFSPDTESLFVGVADRTYGSLLEFNRRSYNHYLDSFF